jgi:hypothetical protein
MRALFLISDEVWTASARAFVLAARGLAARGHDVALACESECAVQVHAQSADVPVVALRPRASSASDAWQLRGTVRERELDAIFVHTDSELLIASSAVRAARGASGVIRRIPPFAVVGESRRVRLATRLTPAGLLFSTEADREAATRAERFRLPAFVAPPGVDVRSHDAVRAANREAFGIAADARVIVCVYDGGELRQALAPIRTVALLAGRHPELHLVIVGDGAQDELRMQGAALGVNASISYLGTRDDELSIIRAADVGWIASRGDAAAFTALDCMAYGIPLIAQRNALTEHFVADGIAGVLLADSDATITAAAVAAFLAKNERRVQMGQAGRTRLLREFSYDGMIAGYEQAMNGATNFANARR